MNNPVGIEQELARSGKLIYPNRGVSMRPLIREGKDLMIIETPKGRLRRYDGALYIRRDGAYVLHRVLKVREHDYVICGDNCLRREYGIRDEQIIGVLTGVIRGGREIRATDLSYRIYAHLWCDFFYIRVAVTFCLHVARAAVRRLRRVVTSGTGGKR